jgi:hypothetical protein
VALAFGVLGLDPAFPFMKEDIARRKDGTGRTDVGLPALYHRSTQDAASAESQSWVKPQHSKASRHSHAAFANWAHPTSSQVKMSEPGFFDPPLNRSGCHTRANRTVYALCISQRCYKPRHAKSPINSGFQCFLNFSVLRPKPPATTACNVLRTCKRGRTSVNLCPAPEPR